MEITWYGHSCFRLSERNMASVVTDPFDHHAIGYEALKLKRYCYGQPRIAWS
jgi:L-ascorbate metabolism protein UlaG (beta-lactamase superfamily)